MHRLAGHRKSEMTKEYFKVLSLGARMSLHATRLPAMEPAQQSMK